MISSSNFAQLPNKTVCGCISCSSHLTLLITTLARFPFVTAGQRVNLLLWWWSTLSVPTCWLCGVYIFGQKHLQLLHFPTETWEDAASGIWGIKYSIWYSAITKLSEDGTTSSYCCAELLGIIAKRGRWLVVTGKCFVVALCLHEGVFSFWPWKNVCGSPGSAYQCGLRSIADLPGGNLGSKEERILVQRFLWF